MGLIDELHEQHIEIKILLKKLLKEIQIKSNQSIIHNHFKNLKKILISHLLNEDNYLYPALRSLEITKEISSSFEDEMNEISSEIMSFYIKYENEDLTETFHQDLKNIINKLVYRITKEEKELYPIFKKHFPNK